MKQADLMKMTMYLESGKAIEVTREDIMEAASYELTGIDFMIGPRQEDIDEFIKKISVNWGVLIIENKIRNTFTIFKN